MRMKFAYVGILLALVLGCQSTSTSEQSWQFYNMNEEPLLLVSETTQLEKLDQLFSSKKQVLLKRKPTFNHRLIMTEGNRKSNWLYSTEGYLTLEKDPQKVIYKINHELINQLLTND